MDRQKPEPRSDTRGRTDGRKALLIYLNQDVIKRLKKAAVDSDKHAYEIAEEAVRQWLAANTTKPRRKIDL